MYFFQNIGKLGLLMVQVEERSGLFVALNVAKLVVSLSLTIVLVVELGWGIRGVLLANLLATAALAIGLGAYMLRQVGLAFSRAVFAKLSRFGAPVAVWTVGSFVLTFSDRYFLNHYTGASAVGVYSLAYKFSFLLSAFAVVPFSQIWEPRRFAIANQPDAADVYRRVFLYLNLALFLGSAGLMLFIRDGLTLLVDAPFRPAYKLVPLLLATTVIQQWTGFCNLGLYLRNATNLYAWSAVIGVAAALGLNALLIPRYGMFGAAWATVLAYAIRFIPVYVFAQAKYRIDYPWAKVGGLGLLLALIWAVRYLADDLSFGVSLAVSCGLLPVVCYAVYAWFLGDEERAFIAEFLKRRLGARAASAA
jgi:O-antigen/teichoic acid export membrane protein